MTTNKWAVIRVTGLHLPENRELIATFLDWAEAKRYQWMLMEHKKNNEAIYLVEVDEKGEIVK